MEFNLGAVQTASHPPNHQLLRRITNGRFPNLRVPAEGLLPFFSTVSNGSIAAIARGWLLHRKHARMGSASSCRRDKD